MSPNTIPPLTAAGAPQLEIELLPNGMTIIKECPEVVPLPESPDEDFATRELGLGLAFSIGDEFVYRVRVFRPDGNDGPTGGRVLVVVDAFDSSEHLWAAHMGVALTFLRDQGPIIQAGMLRELVALYGEERADRDAVAHGFRNREHTALEKWRKRKAS